MSTIIDKQVVAAADDGHVRDNAINNTGTLTHIGQPDYIYHAFYRFTGITIPQNSTITSCYPTFHIAYSNAGALSRAYFEKAQNPNAIASWTDFNSRTLTTAYTDFNGVLGESNTWVNTPSLVTALQELVNTYGLSNQAVQILVKNNGSDASNSHEVHSWDYSTHAYGAKLHIEYTSEPSVSTLEATNVTSSGATLNLNLTNLGTASSVAVSFEYGTTTSYGSTATATGSPASATGTYSANISSLSASTSYHFRAKAIGDGDAVYGDDMVLVTSGVGELGWGHRLKITIDATKIDATLSDFPVLLKLSIAAGWNNDDVTAVFDELGSSSKKIAVTLSDGSTQCYVEISHWDAVNERAALWVKVPSISLSTDTIIYLYYDSAQSDNTTYVGTTTSAVSQNVWDSNYMCVLHLVEQGNGTSNEYKDSTSNANHAASVASKYPSMVVDTTASNAIGIPCQDFAGDGTNRRDRIIIPDADTLSMSIPGGITVEGFLAPDKASSTWNYDTWIFKGRNDDRTVEWGHHLYALNGYGGTEARFGWTNWYICDPDLSTQPGSDFRDAWTINTWMHVAGVSTNTDASHGTIHIYRNGVNSISGHGTSGTYSPPFTYENCGHEVRIGFYDAGNTARWYSGLMREIRISNIERSAAWIKATYYSGIDDLVSYVPEDIESPVAPSVTTGNASSVLYTSATLNGSVTNLGSAAFSIVSFEYGTTTSYGNSVIADESPLSGIGTFSAGISNLSAGTTYHFRAKALGDAITYGNDNTFATETISIPTVTTSVVTYPHGDNSAALFNGTISDIGGESPTTIGVQVGLVSGSYSDTYSSTGVFGVAVITKEASSDSYLGRTIYYRMYATNSAGTGYGSERSQLYIPAAPSGVDATSNQTDRITVTWSKSTGATGYKIYRDDTLIATLGDVATYDDTGATAPVIVSGHAVASKGTSLTLVGLVLSGETTFHTEHTYNVIATNATGNSDSSSDAGGVIAAGSLTYQWQRSSADSNADYSNIDGATTSGYSDTNAPADGSGRYYKCALSATGCTSSTSGYDRGYRAVTTPNIKKSGGRFQKVFDLRKKIPWDTDYWGFE